MVINNHRVCFLSSRPETAFTDSLFNQDPADSGLEWHPTRLSRCERGGESTNQNKGLMGPRSDLEDTTALAGGWVGSPDPISGWGHLPPRCLSISTGKLESSLAMIVVG